MVPKVCREAAENGALGSRWDYFGVVFFTLGLLWGDFEDVRITFTSLWSVFKKQSFSQQILMIL